MSELKEAIAALRRTAAEKAAELVRGGKSIPEAARACGLSYNTVKRACLEIDGDLPQRQGLDAKTFRILAALIDPDRKIGTIPAEFGCSFTRVYKILELARQAGFPGIPPRKGEK